MEPTPCGGFLWGLLADSILPLTLLGESGVLSEYIFRPYKYEDPSPRDTGNRNIRGPEYIHHSPL